MNDNKLDVFESASVSKAVFKNAIPSIMAMIMVLVYNMADLFFIGQTHDDFQVAAVSLGTPVFLIFMSLGTLFGIGGTSVISRSLGKKDTDYAKKVCSFCMWASAAVGTVLTLIMLVFINPILSFIGTSPDTLAFTKTYLMIVSLCGPFVIIGNCYSNIIRAEGNSNTAMFGMVLGNLLNIILDPIMILVFKWNIAGAAIATVIGNIAGAVYYLSYYWRGKSILSISLKDFTYKENVLKGVMAIGIPASLGSLLLSVAHIIANALMSAYGDMAVAAIGVSMKVMMIIIVVAIGLGQGVQPLMGYCVGARNRERFKSIVKFSTIFSAILGIIMTVICLLLLTPLVKVFLTDEAAFEYGVKFTEIMLTTSIPFCIFFVFLNALQAMGEALPSLIISVCRQGIIYIPAMFILNVVMGMNGIAWAQPVADLLSTALVIILYIRSYKKIFDSTKTNADLKLQTEQP